LARSSEARCQHTGYVVLQAITYNKQLREQIDNLRRERLMFEAINANLDKELARIKRSIAGQHSTAQHSTPVATRHALVPWHGVVAAPAVSCIPACM
jgi:hypothetical protein